MRSRLFARPAAFSVLLLVCVLLTMQHVVSHDAGLRRNLTLTRLWKAIAVLSPPRAEELIGLQQRPPADLPADDMNLLLTLDDRSVLPGAILALLGQPLQAQRWLQSHAIANGLDRYWLALTAGQQNQAAAAIHLLTGVDGIDQYFAQAGLNAQGVGQFEQASRLLAAAANLDNGHIEDHSLVYEYLAKNAYNQMHDWDASFYWAERWIQAVPDNTYAYTWLAGLYLWRSQPEQAYAALQRGQPYGIEQNPYYPGQIGEIYQTRGQWELAIEAYRRSWELQKDVTWMRPYVAWDLGFALYHEGQWDEARPYLEIAAQEGIQSAADTLAQMEAGNSP